MAEARIERRLVAILAVDVAGFSWLMSADETGTLSALGPPVRTDRAGNRTASLANRN